MGRLISAVSVTVVVVAFSMANVHHVELDYPFGEPIRVRLVFLLWIAFGTGFLGTTFYSMAVRARRVRSLRDSERDEIVDAEFEEI